jgi:hypothetical protein
VAASLAPYTAASGVAFTFSPVARSFDDAEADCNRQGGHLASYTTLAEQVEVENWFVGGVSSSSRLKGLGLPCNAAPRSRHRALSLQRSTKLSLLPAGLPAVQVPQVLLDGPENHEEPCVLLA